MKNPAVANMTVMNGNGKVVLFDTHDNFENLLPLSYTRPIGAFRVGILTIREKWERLLSGDYSYFPEEYLREKYPVGVGSCDEALFINGNILPDPDFVKAAHALVYGGYLKDERQLLAFRGTLGMMAGFLEAEPNLEVGPDRVEFVYDIFLNNGKEIVKDYSLIVKGGSPVAPDRNVTVIGPASLPDGSPSLYIEEGAQVEACVLNVKDGPIYIGRNAEVMEGACLRGPLALCDNAKVRMGARIYGASTFGPYCKVGGEIDNAVMFGYSNKAHDGYLGNAVIGEWCNIGAGANASNLKNDYSKIRIWNYARKSFMRTDLQFCGLIMGDHSKAGINTMFNTATVVGVGVNLHGAGFPRVFIPSFSAGSPEGGFSDVSIDKFMDVAGKVMLRRDIVLGDIDRRIFDNIYRSASRFK